MAEAREFRSSRFAPAGEWVCLVFLPVGFVLVPVVAIYAAVFG